jgi:hypothetical protein
VGVTASTEKLLALRSGGFCAIPGCGKSLATDATDVSPAKVRGQIAHIAGSRPGAARFDSTMTDSERDSIDNLIFVCRDHHADIDSQPETYTTEHLKRIKGEHELSVRGVLARELAQMTFVELAAVSDAFAKIAESVPVDSNLLLTPVAEKVAKNDLAAIAEDIRLGASRVTVVRDFIQQQTKLDATFSDRLRFGFISLYSKYRYEGKNPVDAYLELVAYARRYSKTNAAPLAIVYTLFEACDIFET